MVAATSELVCPPGALWRGARARIHGTYLETRGSEREGPRVCPVPMGLRGCSSGVYTAYFSGLQAKSTGENNKPAFGSPDTAHSADMSLEVFMGRWDL